MNPLDARCSIAAAMSVDEDSVTVSRLSANERRTAIHCRALVAGLEVFAKILVRDSYPAWEPVTSPHEGMYANDVEQRQASQQIEHEWIIGHRLSALHAPVTVPCPLGRSIESRSIVWEARDGRTVRELLSRSSLHAADRTAGMRAMECIGIWLRRLHDTYATGDETFSMAEVRENLQAVKPTSAHNARYLSLARELLDEAAGKLGDGEFPVTRSLTHGDLSLHNILHDRDTGVTALVDFEHTAFRPTLHDFVTLLSNTRGKLFNPLASHTTARMWEDAFWAGYGEIALELKTAATALAGAWVFYWMFGRTVTNGLAGQAYRSLLQGVYSRRALRRLKQEIGGFSGLHGREAPTAPYEP